MENEELHILKLETNGHCFICLKFKTSGNGGGRAPHVELNHDEEGGDSPSIYSLQKLTNHLEIDLKKLFKRAVNMPANNGFGLSGQTEVKASLCERCSTVLNGLSPLLQEIENIRLKINKGLEILSQGIEEGDTNPALSDSYNKRIKKNITSMLMSAFIDGLRMQISKKCSNATKVPQSSRHLSTEEDSDDDDIEILGDHPSFTETVSSMPFLSPCHRPTLPHDLLIPQVNLNEEDDDIMVLGEFADQTASTSSPVANKPVINRRSQPIKEPTIVPGSSRSLNPKVLSKPTQHHPQPTTFVKETMPIILPALNEVPPPPLSTNDLPFKCTLCKVKGYRTRKQLQRHRKSCRAKHATPQSSSFKPKPSPHKRKFKCRDPDCEKEFAMAITAQVHYRAMHLGIRLSCNICNQGGFYDLSNLNKHKKIKHRNEWNARRGITQSENVAGPTTSSNVYIVHEPSGAVHSLPAYESNDFSADLQDLIGC